MTFSQDFKSIGGLSQKVPAKMQRIPKYGKPAKKQKSMADKIIDIQSAFPSFDQPTGYIRQRATTIPSVLVIFFSLDFVMLAFDSLLDIPCKVQLKSVGHSGVRDPNVSQKSGFRKPTESLGINLKSEDTETTFFRPPSVKSEKKSVEYSSNTETTDFQKLKSPKRKHFGVEESGDPNISRSPGKPKGLFGTVFNSKPADDGQAKVVSHMNNHLKKSNQLESVDEQSWKIKDDINDPFASSFAKFDKIMAESKTKKHHNPVHRPPTQEQFEAQFDPV